MVFDEVMYQSLVVRRGSGIRFFPKKDSPKKNTQITQQMESSFSDESLETSDNDETILTVQADPIEVNKGRSKAARTNLDGDKSTRAATTQA